MLQIDNHEEKAQEAIIPYLSQFPEIIGLVKNSGTRYQNIENIAWELLYNLDPDSANGVWLDYIGRKVGQSRTYAPIVEGAFTFGGTTSQGFGAGKFMSSALVGPNTKISRTDANFRNAIKAKIIENNTDCSFDELINACKLLYNASIVLIEEDYPAGVESVSMYGSSLIQSSNANTEVRKMMPISVSLNHVYFYNFYNLFKNNAFISYGSDYLIPSSDDFTLSFSFLPDALTGDNIYLLSQATLFSQIPLLSIYYNSTDGIVFGVSPELYSDGYGIIYNDGTSTNYAANEGSLILSGGTINNNEINTVKITKESTTYTLYVNDTSVDSEISDVEIGGGPNYNLYLGVSDNNYFNSGSIYNLYLKNDTTSSIILNDTLKTETIYGTNNGVKFI